MKRFILTCLVLLVVMSSFIWADSFAKTTGVTSGSTPISGGSDGAVLSAQSGVVTADNACVINTSTDALTCRGTVTTGLNAGLSSIAGQLDIIGAAGGTSIQLNGTTTTAQIGQGVAGNGAGILQIGDGVSNAAAIKLDGSKGGFVGFSSVATVGAANILTADGTFATSTGWTAGAGWTIGSGVATHATGNTATLAGTSTATSTSIVYQVTFDVTASVAGDGFGVSLGGADSGITISTAGSKTIYVTPTAGTGTLVFTPGTAGTFVGTIDNVAIHALTASTPDTSVTSSDGTTKPLEIRSGGDALNSLFIGNQAGQFNSTIGGSHANIAVGPMALMSNTEGSGNNAFGWHALQLNKQGSNNNAFGTHALLNNTASNNSAFGYSTLTSNTSGYNNSGFGVQALTNNTTGYNNSAVGFTALDHVTTGYQNTAIGFQSGLNDTTGVDNTAIGNQALSSNQTFNFNTAVGDVACFSCVSAGNVAVGESALYATTTPGYNTAVGYNALSQMIDGGYNTALGSLAGNASIHGTSNVFLGRTAGYYETGDNKLFIDNATRASEADGRLKALIYGVFAAATANQSVTFNAKVTVVEKTTLSKGLLLTPLASPPDTCTDATNVGELYYDTSDALCVCTKVGAAYGWNKLVGDGTCA